MIEMLGTTFVALLGLAFGSFMNVCLSRWPNDEGVVSPRSHCRSCYHRLTWWENVPLVSWLALRGRCRKCHERIGWRYPLVELGVAVLWSVPAWKFFSQLSEMDLPLSQVDDELFLLVAWMFFYWLIVALAVLDAEHLWLPDRLTLLGTVAGWLVATVHAALVARSPLRDPNQTALHAVTSALLGNVAGIVVAAGLILLISWVYWLFRRREGIGLGDAKLMALLAAWLSLPGALLAFGIGVLLGAVAALILLAVPKSKSDANSWALKKLPLGTFLCAGGIVSSFWSRQIIDAYLRWSGF
jgi:leader peptidase (prepilin peptidase) / N-methyltransferase